MISRSDLYFHLHRRGWTARAAGETVLLETTEDTGVSLATHENVYTDLMADYSVTATFGPHCPASVVIAATDQLLAERRVNGAR